MTAAATFGFAVREWRTLFSSSSALVLEFVQAIVLCVIFGVGVSAMLSTNRQPDFAAYTSAGILTMTVVTSAIGRGVMLSWQRSSGDLKHALTAPVPRWCVAAGRVLAIASVATVQAVLFVPLQLLLGAHPSMGTILVTALAAGVCAATWSSAAQLAAVLFRRPESLQPVMQVVMMPLLFLSGSVFMIDHAPTWLAIAVRLNPLTYAVDLIRAAATNQLSLGSAAILTGSCLATVAAVAATGRRLENR